MPWLQEKRYMGKLKTQKLTIGKKQDFFQEHQERSPCGEWKAAEDHKRRYLLLSQLLSWGEGIEKLTVSLQKEVYTLVTINWLKPGE